MLHPVGPLPAAVYWRRRVLVLLLAGAVVGGGGWLATTAIDWRPGPAEASSGGSPARGQVLPSLAGAQAPTPVCTDEMIDLTVRAPAAAVVGSRPTFQLVVTNMSTAACVRSLGAEQQEIVLADATGQRIWSSADCLAEGTGSQSRTTLTPGQAVSLDVVWGGRRSEPTCMAERVSPPPGRYVLRGRVGTKAAPEVALTLT